MTNKEVVQRITKLHDALNDVTEIIDAIDIALFDLAVEFTDVEDFPQFSEEDLDEMKESMKELKKYLYDEKHGDCDEHCCSDISKAPECMIPDIGDTVIITDIDGVNPNNALWVFENIKDKDLVVRYAYGVTPEDDCEKMTVVGYDDDKKHYYIFSEKKDECYIVDRESIAKYVTGEEAIEMIEKLL